MRKPIIGITPLYDPEENRIWMKAAYTDCLVRAGAVPVVLPLTEDPEAAALLASRCDGLLFTGGQDVDPALYKAAPIPELGPISPQRDAFEAVLLEAALAQDKPVLGICRGLQFLNAALGGTLWQDLPACFPSEIHHSMEKPYARVAHTVKLQGPIAEVIGQAEIGVNSCHHQAVKDLAPGFTPMALSPDGLVEAFWAPDRRFFWAVQWHPEMMPWDDEPSRKIFNAFIEAI